MNSLKRWGSLLAAPLLAGNDLRSMSEETKSILTNAELIAVDQDPDGRPARRVSDAESTAVVVVRPLHDGSVAVGLFNRGEQKQVISLKLEALGLVEKKLQARDLWQHADVELPGDRYEAMVPAHGVVLLKVR